MKPQTTATRKFRGIGSSQLADALATLMGAVADRNPERGRRIQKLRRVAGFSSAQKLAEHLHVGVRTVQYWEAGHEIGAENLPRLAKALKVKTSVIDPPLAAAVLQDLEGDQGLSANDVTRLETRLDALTEKIDALVEALTPQGSESSPQKPPKPRPAPKPRGSTAPPRKREAEGN